MGQGSPCNRIDMIPGLSETVTNHLIAILELGPLEAAMKLSSATIP